MESLNESVTLVADGKTITLPLVNLLRILLVKLTPFMLQYQQDTGDSGLSGFYEWMRDKTGMKGKNVLL